MLTNSVKSSLFFLALPTKHHHQIGEKSMSSPNSKSNGIGGATAGSLIAPQTCNCLCHSSGNEFPCGGMCWHPGVDQYGLPLNYSYASVTQLLRAALVYGVSDKAIESAIYESFVLSAS